MRYLIVAALVTSNPFMASASSFAPKHKPFPSSMQRLNSGIDEVKFHSLIREIEAIYTPIVARLGANLVIESDWSSIESNAYADQEGTQWKLMVSGGLARRPEITPDGFSLILCHELGHHLGGYPFGTYGWDAAEGQADYFASFVCARKIWLDELEVNARARLTTPTAVKERCNQVWSDQKDQDLCYRIALAGKSAADFLAAVERSQGVYFDKPDPQVVAETIVFHPSAQCRLDTYVNGALCHNDYVDSVVPGLDHPLGQNSLEAEFQASLMSCSEMDGHAIRPKCWFRDRLGLNIREEKVNFDDGNQNGYPEPGESLIAHVPLVNFYKREIKHASLAITFENAGSQIGQSVQELRDLPPGQPTWLDSPIEITIPSTAKCGTKLNLTAQSTTNVGRQFHQSFSVPLGDEQILRSYSDSRSYPIPDDNELVLDIPVENLSQVSRTILELQISHSYPQELEITLSDPSGHKHTIKNNLTARRSIAAQIPSLSKTTGGLWQLKIRDTQPGDIGTLLSSNLVFHHFHCAQL
jgi:hypothetical protein